MYISGNTSTTLYELHYRRSIKSFIQSQLNNAKTKFIDIVVAGLYLIQTIYNVLMIIINCHNIDLMSTLGLTFIHVLSFNSILESQQTQYIIYLYNILQLFITIDIYYYSFVQTVVQRHSLLLELISICRLLYDMVYTYYNTDATFFKVNQCKTSQYETS